MSSLRKSSRIISMFLAIILISGSFVAFATEREITASGTTGALTWTLYNDGELVISGEGYMPNFTYANFTYTAPWYGYRDQIKSAVISQGVKRIGVYAFKNCSKLKDITIASSVVSMSNDPFDNALENVFYMGSLSDWCKISFGYAGSNPLYYDVNLYIAGELVSDNETLTLPSDISIVESYAFANADFLKSVIVPDNVIEIRDYAFRDCDNLTNVVLSDQLKKLHCGVFKNCTSLTEIYIPDNVNIYDSYGEIFRGCNKLEKITVSEDNMYFSSDDDGVLFNKAKTEIILFPLSGVESYSVPNTVNSIGSSCFNSCTNLKSITIPDSVKIIGEKAFFGCEQLENISVTDSIEYIGKSAFDLTGYANDYANWDNGLLYLETLLIGSDPESLDSIVKLYSKTTLIASYTFDDNDDIEAVICPENLKYINDYAFNSCKYLKTVSLNSGLLSIGKYAFLSCSSLKSVNVPGSVKVISHGAFAACDSIEELYLGEGVSSIEEYAFGNIDGSQCNIYIPATVKEIDAGAFTASSKINVFYLDSKAEWKRATIGTSFDYITIHYTLKSDDGSVIIQHTDENFDWESGNIHLDVAEITSASPTYDRNGYYNKNMIAPIKVLDIKIVDGDGNPIQPLSDENITVKIKAPDEFKNLILNSLNLNSEIEFSEIEFSNGVFTYEHEGEAVTLTPSNEILNKFKIVHWFSDGTQPGDYEVFKYDRMAIKDGYIVLETNHFSEYAVCTDMIEFEQAELEIENGKTAQLNVTAGEGDTVTYSSSDENVATVDSNGVVTAVGPGSATITATVDGTGVTATCTVSVPFRTFTVKWIVDGAVTEQKFIEQSTLSTPAEAPKKDGYVFKGWSPEVPDTMPAENLTFTAVFEPAAVTDIEIISLPAKTAYVYKSGFVDLSGIELKVTYEDGTSKTVNDTSKMSVSGFDNKLIGTQAITVEYEGATVQFDVTVSYVWWQWIIRILFLGIFWY